MDCPLTATRVPLPPGRVQKGFPDDSPTLQAEMEAWFSQYGKVNAVRKRMTEAKKFKVRPVFRPPSPGRRLQC